MDLPSERLIVDVVIGFAMEQEGGVLELRTHASFTGMELRVRRILQLGRHGGRESTVYNGTIRYYLFGLACPDPSRQRFGTTTACILLEGDDAMLGGFCSIIIRIHRKINRLSSHPMSHYPKHAHPSLQIGSYTIVPGHLDDFFERLARLRPSLGRRQEAEGKSKKRPEERSA
jgi:hypothetical protein